MKAPKLTLPELAIYAYISSFPLMAYAPISVAGKSIVLPYLISLMLVPCAVSRIKIGKYVNIAVLFLFIWLAWIGGALLLVGLAGDVTIKAVTQLANVIIMTMQFMVLRIIVVRMGLIQIERLRRVFTAVIILVGLFALYEFTALEIGLPFQYVLRNANTYSIRSEPVATTFFDFQLIRVMATTPEPCFLGSYLAVALAWIMPDAISGRNRMYRLAFLFLLGILFLTFARTAWLALFGALVYAFVRPSRGSLKRYLTPGLVIMVSVMAFALLGGQAVRLFTASVEERWLGQVTGLKLLWKYPITGVGLGGYESAATDLWGGAIEALVQGALSDTFNLYLRLGAETGVIGLGLFLLFILVLWWRLARVRTGDLGEPRRSLVRGLEYALVTIFITWLNLGAYNLSYIWFILALASAVPTQVAPRRLVIAGVEQE